MARFTSQRWGDSAYRSANPTIDHGVQRLRLFIEPIDGDEDDGLSDPGGFWRTEFARAAKKRGEETEHAVTCMLDVIYVWLVEGDAVEACPTYESYLLTVIGAVDSFEDGWFRWRYATDTTPGFMMFNWGAEERAPDGTLIGTNVDDEAGLIEAGLDHEAESYAHPALRRDIYEYHRAHFHERYAIRKRDGKL